MSAPIISVENLGKAYRLGQQEEKYPTFRDALVGAAKAPLRRFQHLSGGGAEDELFWALKDVSFEVNRGEVVGIIGRNGAGKSTLLKILSRITEPTRGRAILRGRVASLLEVGTGFHPELTGRENIYLNGSILGMKKTEIDRKFDEIVAFAEVEKFLDTPVKRYSSGMYVRLAFAVAAHLEPEILIVDEVLAVGDAQFQKKCLGKMQEVSQGGGRTVLFVSHNMAAISALCNHAFLLVGGEVAASGDAMAMVGEYGRTVAVNAATQVHGLSSVRRAANLQSVIRSVTFRDRASGSNVLFTGHDVEIRIEYIAKAPITAPRFGIRIRDACGVPQFMLSTETMATRPPILPASGTLCCTIRNFPLLPGTYYASPGCASGGVQLDALPDAVTFTVAESDPYGTGWLPSADMGHFCVNSHWYFGKHTLPGESAVK